MKARHLLCLLAGAMSAAAALPPGWSTNFAGTLAEATAAQQPMLAYFTASWCQPCQIMTRTTLTNASVIQGLSTFKQVAVDIDDQHDLAAQHDVRAVPTFAIFSSAGDEVARTTGYQDAADFISWLTNGVAEAKEAVLRQARYKEQLAKIDQLLATNTVETTRAAATNLFDLCSERDASIAPAAATRLKTLAAREPSVLLEGLNHPRLATRIQVANALRAKLGESFDLDPWSNAPTRKSAVAKWKAKLNSPL